MPTPSFRGRLALRFGLLVMLLAFAGSTLTYIALRHSLFGRLDAMLQRLAQIEAAATSDSPDETVHFHEEMFHSPEQDDSPDLIRYAQVWTLDGDPVVRTDNLGSRDLPLPRSLRERVVAAREPELFTIRWNGEQHRSLLYPLVLVGEQHHEHLLQVAASTTETKETLRTALQWLAALVLVGMAAGAAGGWWLAGYAVDPVLEIIHQAEAFDTGRPQHRIVANSDTQELSRLVAVLNSMLGQIDATLDAQRRFLADAGHSIKTPLTVLRGDVEVALLRRRTQDEYEGVLDQALGDLKAVSALAEDLITLARSDGGALVPDFQQIRVADLLAGVVKRFESAAERASLRLSVDSDDNIWVKGDPTLLDRAIGNVLDNAIMYAASGGIVTLSAAARSGGLVEILVSDRGPGISQHDQENLFERFYRGKAERTEERGFGLGLPIAKAIVESHGGSIGIASTPGSGTTVTLRLADAS